MKIALFTETYLPDVNGVAAHVDTLRIGLTELGHQVLVVAADKRAKKHYLEDGILHCPSIESKRFYGFGVAPPFSKERFRYVADFAPDLIHIHHEFGVGLSGLRAAKKLNIPLVYTLHTMYDLYIHYVAPRTFTRFATKVSHRYERFVANRATILASPSRKGEDYFRRIGVSPDKEFALIPNSADFEAFHPHIINQEEKSKLREQLKIPADRTIACFVGRLGGEKSVDVLLDYWAEAIKKDDNLHLLIIGNGPDHIQLQTQAKVLKISNQVTFTGRVDHEEVPKFFAICDAFITASLSEMNSISMLEGMASGLPAIQRYDELNADQIQVGINGNHYHNAPEMAEYLQEISRLSPTEKDNLKARVRDSVKDRDCKGLALHVLSVYEEALAIKASQPKGN